VYWFTSSWYSICNQSAYRPGGSANATMFVVFGNSNGIYQQTIEAGQKSCVSLEN
jgi:hypothetical protein